MIHFQGRQLCQNCFCLLSEKVSNLKRKLFIVFSSCGLNVHSLTGLTLPTSDPIYSKATVVKADKRNSKMDTQMMIVENKPPRQDENKEPRNNKGDNVNNKSMAKTTESRKNKKNRRDKENDRVPDIGLSVDDNTITVPTMSVSSVMSSGMDGNKGKKLTPSNKKKKGERFGRDVTVGSSTTGL